MRKLTFAATDSLAVGRRKFLKIAGNTTAAVMLRSWLEAKSTQNLVPPQPRPSLSYWCSWVTQNSPRTDDLRGTLANLNEETLLHNPGWVSRHYEKIRGDLIVVLDEGWDLPPQTDVSKEIWPLGSLELQEEKFPSCGGSPAARLRKLNDMIRKLGWAGVGVWVPAQLQGDGRNGKLRPPEDVVPYWTERARWCADAGIAYWKVDWGARSRSVDFRRTLSRIARGVAPGLRVEHAVIVRPVNEPQDGSGRFAHWTDVKERAFQTVAFSDVFRGYDILYQMPTATMLDRIATLLQAAPALWEGPGFINSEDEVYLGAALGCTLGIMRHPQWRSSLDTEVNPVQYHKRIDEAVRAVRWQRIAPPVRIRDVRTVTDEHVLTDRYHFSTGQTWATEVIGKEFTQSAPARVARGMPLPSVVAPGDMPFVVASRHPNGAIAVAALERTLHQQIVAPRAAVEIEVGAGRHPIGIFGLYESLILHATGLLKGCRIWAQDLAGDEAVDITKRCFVEGTSVRLEGTLLADLGRIAQTPGDLSLRGLVIQLTLRSSVVG